MPAGEGDSLTRVTDENYESFLQAPASVVVFSIAPCRHCEEYEPVVLEAASSLNGAVKFGKAKLHVPGACREIKRRYKFKSFPTTHFYKSGELVHIAEEKLDLPVLKRTIEQVFFAQH